MFLLHDFLSLWAGGRLALAGQNPYEEALVIKELLAAGVPLTHHPGGFHNPPWSIWLFAPLSVFNLPIAQLLCLVTTLATLIGSALMLVRLEQGTTSASRHNAFARALFVTFLFYPVQKLLLFGQSTHFVLIGLILFILCIKVNHNFLAGIGLSLTFIKPHLLLAVYLMILIRAVRAKNWWLFAGASAGLAVQALVSYALAPQMFSGYAAYLSKFYSEREAGMQVTLGHVLGAMTGRPAVIWVAIVLGLLAAAILSFSKLNLLRMITLIGVPVSLLGAPYAWSHDHVLLLPAFLSAAFWGYTKSLNRARILVLLLNIGCWLVVMSDFPKREASMIALPLILLIYGVFSINGIIHEKIHHAEEIL